MKNAWLARIAEKARLTHHWHALFEASKRVVDECGGEGVRQASWGPVSLRKSHATFDDKLPK